MSPAHIRHHAPLALLVPRERDRGDEQVCAPATPDEGLGLDVQAVAEAVELRRGEEPAGRTDPLRPCRGRPQGLVGLVPVSRDGAQAKQGQSTGGVELILLVGIRQGAELHLERARQAIGQHVLDPIDHVDLHGLRGEIEEGGSPDEPEALAGHPGRGEAQAEIVVDLLEHHPVAVDALGDAASDLVDAGVA
jgi:hypothetical protein